MAETETTKQQELVDLITESVSARVKKDLEPFLCPLNPGDKESVRGFYQFIKDIGDKDDISSGVKNLRHMADFVIAVRNKKTVATGMAFTITVAAIIGWVVIQLAGGAKVAIKTWILNGG